jgi:epoxyqueuosine reductase
MSGRLAAPRVPCPVVSSISKRVYRHIFQDVCPWNRKFSVELAGDSPFRAREFIAGKDAVWLATDILELDQVQFSAAFRKSPMKRAKRAGLQRNAAVVLRNTDTCD